MSASNQKGGDDFFRIPSSGGSMASLFHQNMNRINMIFIKIKVRAIGWKSPLLICGSSFQSEQLPL